MTKNDNELVALGKKTGEALRQQKNGPLVLALVGELGSGKTTFVRGLAKGLGIRARITSPTFVLAKRYRVPAIRNKKQETRNKQDTRYKKQETNRQYFWHMDAYRLKDGRDLAGIDFEEIVSDSANIVAIEWANKIKRAIPKGARWIRFFHLPGNRRKIIFSME